jgi:hypothetical protein
MAPSAHIAWRIHRVRLLVVAVCVAVLSVVLVQPPANAASPHFVHTSATLNEPTVFTDEQFGFVLLWAAEATLTFQLAGMGNNRQVTVSAASELRFAAALARCDGANTLAAVAVITTGDTTLTSDRNGVVKGAIILREVFAAAATSLPPSGTCGQGVRVAYDGLTLTVAGTQVQARLGNLRGTFVRGAVAKSEIPPFPASP